MFVHIYTVPRVLLLYSVTYFHWTVYNSQTDCNQEKTPENLPYSVVSPPTQLPSLTHTIYVTGNCF